MKNLSKKLIGLLGLATLYGVANAAYVINGNFCSVANINAPPAGLNSGSAAWNDLTSSSGGFGANDSTNNLKYTDGSTVDPGITMQWIAGSQAVHGLRATTDVDGGHEQLFAGHLITGPSVTTITLVGSGVLPTFKIKDGSVTSYDVYIYTDIHNGTPFSATLTSGTTSGSTVFYGNDSADFITIGSTPVGGGLSDYVSASSTNSGAPTVGANYVKFSGITSNDFAIVLTSTTGGSVGLNGFEITAIPEPGTLAMAGILLGTFGGLHLLKRRKR